jgi:hypothetical protein
MAKLHYIDETGTVCSKQRKSKIDRAYEKAILSARKSDDKTFGIGGEGS